MSGFTQPYEDASRQYTEWSRQKQEERKQLRMTDSEVQRYVAWPTIVAALDEERDLAANLASNARS